MNPCRKHPGYQPENAHKPVAEAPRTLAGESVLTRAGGTQDISRCVQTTGLGSNPVSPRQGRRFPSPLQAKPGRRHHIPTAPPPPEYLARRNPRRHHLIVRFSIETAEPFQSPLSHPRWLLGGGGRGEKKKGRKTAVSRPFEVDVRMETQSKGLGATTTDHDGGEEAKTEQDGGAGLGDGAQDAIEVSAHY